MNAHTAQRYHWLNTLVGILDTCFHLTEEELLGVTEVVGKLLDVVRVPSRGTPVALPMQLVQEMQTGVYSQQIAVRDSSGRGPGRAATRADCVASVEAWAHSLESLLLVAHPDLSYEEKLLSIKVLTDLIAALGVPDRAAYSLPESVIHAAHEMDL